jgi:tetratricopeptide (TPR) repeat protein
MSYPGSSDLDQKVQQRILAAFGESVRLYREGHGEECRTILRSILEVDPKFSPAQRLEDAIVRGAQVDLAQVLGAVTAAAPLQADETIGRAREAIAKRDFQGALALAQSVLRELPGHPEARALALDAQARIRAAAEVESQLSRAEAALAAGMLAEATGFVKMALAADSAHPRLAALLQRIQDAAPEAAPEPEPEFEFETFRPADTPELPADPQPSPVVPAPPPPPLPAASGPAPPAAASPAAERPAAPQARPAPGPAPLFTFDDAPGDVQFGADAAGGDEAADRIAALLEQGQEAFDRDDYQGAIDAWSRIYLLDAHHAEAERRIEQARRRGEEHQRLAEHRFYEAREAFEAGRSNEARGLLQEVLRLVPQHLEAHDLLARLDTPAAPPPPPTEAADEIDLFKDDFVPAKLAAPAAAAAAPPAPLAVPADAPVVRPSRRSAAPARRLPVSVPLIAGIGGMVVVLVLVGLVLRGTVFSGNAAAVAAALAEAEKLAAAGKLQEAVTLLQATEAEGEEANQLNQKALEYTRQLRAKARAPVSTAGDARKALAEGRRLKALQLAREGLARIPGDPELVALSDEVLAYSPAFATIADAVAGRKWDLVRAAAADVLARHSGDAEAERLWRAATFNAAVTALRAYQVAAAHRLLLELQARGDDVEVRRLVELAGSYLSRPVDPRYQIFVGTIETRPVE